MSAGLVGKVPLAMSISRPVVFVKVPVIVGVCEIDCNRFEASLAVAGSVCVWVDDDAVAPSPEFTDTPDGNVPVGVGGVVCFVLNQKNREARPATTTITSNTFFMVVSIPSSKEE